VLQKRAFQLNKQDHIVSLGPDWTFHGIDSSQLHGYDMEFVEKME
jgi:hypothetical protein